MAPLLLSACVEVDPLPIAEVLPPGTKTILLAASAPGRALQLYSVSGPFALPVAPAPEQRLLAVALGRDLEALDLPPGLLTDLPEAGGREIPEPLGAFVSRNGEPFVAYREAPELFLPPHDWPAILARPACADGPYYVGKSCTASVAVAVARPALPDIRQGGACPDGWLALTHAFSGGPTLGMQSVELCAPPPRQSCGAGERQAAAERACVAVGPACSASDPFAPGLSLTSTVVYVLAGASAGDGSRARPFGTLAEGARAAASRGASVLAIGRGTYPEGLSIAGALDVVGACAAETTIQGGLGVRAHSGRISGLTVRTAGSVLQIEAQSTTELHGVVLSATSSAADVSGIQDSEARLSDAVVRLPDRGVWQLKSAKVTVIDSQIHGQLHVARSGLTVLGSALSTGGGAVVVVEGSTMTVERSYVATQLLVDHSGLDARRSWFVPDRVEGFSEQSSILSSRGWVHLAQSTIDHRRPVIREPLVAPVETQTGVDIRGSTVPSLIEDVVILLHEPPAEPPRQHFIGLGFFQPIAVPHVVRRATLIGGTFAAIGINTSYLRAEDLGIYRVRGTGILGPEARLETARLEIGDLRGGGMDIGGAGQASLVDTGIYDVDRTNLGFRGEGPFAALRTKLACERGATVGVHMADSKGSPVASVLRQISVVGPFDTGLHSGFSSQLDLAGFEIEGVSRGILLFGAGHGRRLSYGSVRATGLGLCLANDQADLHELLDHVGVSAPTLLERGE